MLNKNDGKYYINQVANDLSLSRINNNNDNDVVDDIMSKINIGEDRWKNVHDKDSFLSELN